MSLKCSIKLNPRKIVSTSNWKTNLSYHEKRAPNLHSESENANAVYFKKVAQIYNRFAEIVSLGQQSKWRKALIDNIDIKNDSQILDAAGGTGLNTVRLLEKMKHLKSDSKFKITVFDASPYMLKIGEDDCKMLDYNPNFVKFIEGDLHKLPFDDESFDTVVMSFAIRSNIDFNVVFKEIYRVLRTRGKFFVVDICYSHNPTIVQRLFCNYVQYIFPILEKIILGNFGASEYALHEIRNTLCESDIPGMMKDANFKNLAFKPLSLGIVGITIGDKL